MLLLILCLLAALLLFVALTLFSRSSMAPDSQPWPPPSELPPSRDLPGSAYSNPSAVTAAIFSPRDWEFIRRERCPALEKLFLAERKAVAAYWLTVTSSRVSDIRKNHLANSRFSRDLSPAQELHLLLCFLYLSLVCRVGLIAIQIAGPMAPAALAAHIQRLADSLPVVRENAYSRVPEF